MSLGAQNMETGLDALRNAENVSGSAKKKSRPDVLRTAENVPMRVINEKGSRRPR
jgi:hypothetical protein